MPRMAGVHAGMHAARALDREPSSELASRAPFVDQQLLLFLCHRVSPSLRCVAWIVQRHVIAISSGPTVGTGGVLVCVAGRYALAHEARRLVAAAAHSAFI